MESRLLEFFLRVAELGSINRAAADLHLSQPALSRQIALLEHEIGAPLFTRTQSGVKLTESGKLLVERARPLLRQFDLLKEQVGDKTSGQVAIGIPPSWQRVVTSPLVQRIALQLPHVALRVHEGVSNVLRDHMYAGLLDLCVVPFDASPAAGYRQTALVREPLALVGNASVALNADEPVTVSQLDGVRLVLPGRPNVMRMQIERVLARQAMAFCLAVETDTLTLCLDLARRGVGLTVVPSCSLYGHESDREISWAPIAGLCMTWVLCENEARTHSQAVRESRKLIMLTVADSIGSGGWFGAEALRRSTVRKP